MSAHDTLHHVACPRKHVELACGMAVTRKLPSTKDSSTRCITTSRQQWYSYSRTRYITTAFDCCVTWYNSSMQPMYYCCVCSTLLLPPVAEIELVCPPSPREGGPVKKDSTPTKPRQTRRRNMVLHTLLCVSSICPLCLLTCARQRTTQRTGPSPQHPAQTSAGGPAVCLNVSVQ